MKSWSFRMLSMILLLGLLVGCPEPDELSITSTSTEANPNCTLSAIVSVETSKTATVEVEFWSDGIPTQVTPLSESGTSHEITLVGMRALTAYSIKPIAYGEEGETVEGTVSTHTTGALPSDIADFTVEVYNPFQMQSGISLIGPGKMGGPGGPADEGPYMFGLDEANEVVWYYDDPTLTMDFLDRDAKMLDDGNLLITLRDGFRVITVGGETVLDVSGDELAGLTLHHDVVGIPDGGFVALAHEVRWMYVETLGGYRNIQGDVLVEWDAGGEVVWEWASLDHLNTERYPGQLSRQVSHSGGVDWTHGNGLQYIEEDGTVVVSLRHQNWVIKVDRQTDEVVWILGEDGDFTLVGGDSAWFYSQHNPELQADGRILIYDNGNERPGTQDYSRAVMYQLDETSMTAEQVWEYETDNYTEFLGGVRLLDNGNVLVCAGGAQRPGTPAQVIEVTGSSSASEVWKISVDDKSIYRANRLVSFWLE